MLIWYSADVGNNCGGVACTNNASQDRWFDQSGNIGNDGTLTPVIVSACVASVYKTNQINGKPAVQFNGTNGPNATCFARSNSGTAIPWSGEVTEFIVAKAGDTGIERAYASGGTQVVLWETGVHLNQIQKATVGVIGTGTASADTNWHQLNFTYKSSTGAFSFRADRAADGSGTNAQTILGTYLTLGMDANFGGRFTFSGEIAEFLLYNSVLSGANITAAEAYLHAKYGL